MEKKRYGAIDGLRTIACFGIVMMHVLANYDYHVSGIIFDRIIPSFTDFVFLFMVVSAFGMCCGYYDKIFSKEIDFTDFYKKRYKKILPFFSVLVFLDLIMNFSRESLYEAIADVSLTFGFFPNHITVIGVGWFLGLIFVFYAIFPFYCVLTENKRRAWAALAVSLVLNFISISYFGLWRSNIVYSSCFFISGGLIYLYRDKLEKLKRYVSAFLMIICISLYYIWGDNTITWLLVSTTMLIFALRECRWLQNKFTKFISSISMEIYLSHMVMFRVIEKLHLQTYFGNGILQYMITVVAVLLGTIAFSVIVKRLLYLAGSRLNK